MKRKLGILLLVLSFLMPTAAYALSGDGDIPEARSQMCTSGGIRIDGETGEGRDVFGVLSFELVLLLDLVMETLAALP